MTDKLSGKGKVYSGKQFITDVHYDHRTQSNYDKSRTLVLSQEVLLQLSPPTAISGYFGERLTLHMSDGRKQDFFVADSNGECKATGGPYQ